MVNLQEEFNLQILKIICAREKEIDIFIPQEFWEINIELSDKNGNKINGSLYSESKKRIEKLSVTNEEQAKRLKANLLKNKFKVEDVIKKEKEKEPLFTIFKFLITSRCIF